MLHVDDDVAPDLSDLEDRYGLWLLEPDSDSPLLLTPPEFDVTAGPFVSGEGESRNPCVPRASRDYFHFLQRRQ